MNTEDEELAELDRESQRPEPKDETLSVFDALRARSAHPVDPVRLKADDRFAFRCHKGVACWNVCCQGADITLTPYDILRLARHLAIRPAEFLALYAIPALHDRANLPIAKLRMGGAEGKGPCPFMTDAGCKVYAERPATCRYYPLGLVSMKMKDAEKKEDFNFLVREDHCQGHAGPRQQTVADWRAEQGTDAGLAVDRGWIDILMKMTSWSSIGGPMGKAPSPKTQKMFFMATTDVDAFRRFVFETRFLDSYELDPAAVERLKADDEALLALAQDWLKNVLFNEPTIALKEAVLKGAIAKAHRDLAAGEG
ncbi:MAG: YkgJ family cysteine cluster protein [Rhodospirillales bacterium]|nr:YkgJ family cysteine cluster protein [Rhodospirillales bacterium]